ncbi:hypothetical protein TWF281_009486 [Arthrobotrys megalospora]
MRTKRCTRSPEAFGRVADARIAKRTKKNQISLRQGAAVELDKYSKAIIFYYISLKYPVEKVRDTIETIFKPGATLSQYRGYIERHKNISKSLKKEEWELVAPYFFARRQAGLVTAIRLDENHILNPGQVEKGVRLRTSALEEHKLKHLRSKVQSAPDDTEYIALSQHSRRIELFVPTPGALRPKIPECIYNDIPIQLAQECLSDICQTNNLRGQGPELGLDHVANANYFRFLKRLIYLLSNRLLEDKYLDSLLDSVIEAGYRPHLKVLLSQSTVSIKIACQNIMPLLILRGDEDMIDHILECKHSPNSWYSHLAFLEEYRTGVQSWNFLDGKYRNDYYVRLCIRRILSAKAMPQNEEEAVTLLAFTCYHGIIDFETMVSLWNPKIPRDVDLQFFQAYREYPVFLCVASGNLCQAKSLIRHGFSRRIPPVAQAVLHQQGLVPGTLVFTQLDGTSQEIQTDLEWYQQQLVQSLPPRRYILQLLRSDEGADEINRTLIYISNIYYAAFLFKANWLKDILVQFVSSEFDILAEGIFTASAHRIIAHDILTKSNNFGYWRWKFGDETKAHSAKFNGASHLGGYCNSYKEQVAQWTEELIGLGADPNTEVYEFWNFVHQAIIDGNERLLSVLIDSKANIDIPFGDISPLGLAIALDQREIYNQLLFAMSQARGLALIPEHLWGTTDKSPPILFDDSLQSDYDRATAAWGNRCGLSVRLELRDYHQGGDLFSCLERLATRFRHAGAQLLTDDAKLSLVQHIQALACEENVCIEETAYDGSEAVNVMQLVAKCGDYNLLKFFLELGPRFQKLVSKKYDRVHSPLRCAVNAKADVKCINLLIENGANVNEFTYQAPSRSGFSRFYSEGIVGTILHQAVFNGCIATTRCLLEHKADMYVRINLNRTGRLNCFLVTPVQAAIDFRRLDTISLFLHFDIRCRALALWAADKFSLRIKSEGDQLMEYIRNFRPDDENLKVAR